MVPLRITVFFLLLLAAPPAAGPVVLASGHDSAWSAAAPVEQTAQRPVTQVAPSPYGREKEVGERDPVNPFGYAIPRDTPDRLHRGFDLSGAMNRGVPRRTSAGRLTYDATAPPGEV